MQQTKPESIWADGIPAKIETKDRLEPKDILHMCVRFVLDNILNSKAYEIMAAHDNPNYFPNIEAKLGDEKYAITVIPCIYPHFIPKNDKLRMGFASKAKEKNYIPVICPIPIRSIDKDRANASVYLKGDLFEFANIGQIIVTEAEEQEILPKTLNFKL